jgi:predicted ATP-dependent serine protease
MSQKEQVEQFLQQLPEGTTLKQSAEIFENNFPTFSMSNFKFYRNQAIKNQVWTPGVEVLSIQPINLDLPVNEVKEMEVVNIDLENIDMEKFKANPTGTAFDKIASKRNGIMPATTYIITGESGAGKTTVAANIADYLKENNPGFTAGFISSEMDRDDWTEECLDNPRLALLDTVFMLEYIDAPNYLEILVEALKKWKYVILDSFEVTIDQLKDIKGWTSKKAESELINMLRRAATESGATIFAIQQYTKGGTFVGSNKIKHMLTGMIYVMFDKNGDRYVVFTKNRRGGHMVQKRLYFTKNKVNGRLEFDGQRLENDLAIIAHSQEELNKIQEEAGLFDNEILEKARELQEKREKLLIVNREALLANPVTASEAASSNN